LGLFWPDFILGHLWPNFFWARFGPLQKKIKKIFSKKFVIFSRIFLSILINIGLYFYTVKIRIRFSSKHCKNDKIKKISCFHAYGQVLKNHIVFSYDKNSKICVSMYFGFNNQFIKTTKTWPIIQKLPKNHFFL